MQGENVVPTDRGLGLFGILERADPALVDPAVTAELEYLLDDVLTGRQEMMGAIDAVCDFARRIIGNLTERSAEGEAVAGAERAAGDEDRAPTAAMRKFAAAIAKRKDIRPPRGYTRSAAVCRAFLDEHAPKRSAVQEAAPSAGGAVADVPPNGEPRKTGVGVRSGQEAKPEAANGRRQRDSGRAAKENSPGGRQAAAGSGTPLRIPYGNKEVAFGLGARYGPDGWYAPRGVDLAAFRERGWL